MLRSVALLCTLLTSVSASAQGNDPSAPFRIADNVYYVGSSDMASLLITTPAGHILIDGGYESTVPIIRANMASLGFKLEDVKVLLNTQAHFDHAAGFAELKRLTGARLMVSAPDADLVERGGHGDFLFGDSHPYPPATVERRLHDGDVVRLGGAALTAHVTGGHTRGCTTWTWDATDPLSRPRDSMVRWPIRHCLTYQQTAYRIPRHGEGNRGTRGTDGHCV